MLRDIDLESEEIVSCAPEKVTALEEESESLPEP